MTSSHCELPISTHLKQTHGRRMDTWHATGEEVFDRYYDASKGFRCNAKVFSNFGMVADGNRNAP